VERYWSVSGRAARWTLIASLLGLSTANIYAADSEPGALGRWWGDFGVGYGYMNASSGPASGNAGGVWLDAQLGGRLNSHWLAGFDLGGVGTHPSSSNYNPNNLYSSVYGTSATNEFLVVQYEPESDHGWFVGAGGGKVLYDNKRLEALTGNSRSGNGTAGIGRIGYDWKVGNRAHAEAVLSYEAGNVSLNAPIAGSFGFSVIALSAHIAYH
jgi:hypothetical protein